MRVPKSYPYPVLGNADDFTTSSFTPHLDVTLDFEQDEPKAILDVRFDLEDETLLQLIQNGDAIYEIDVQCGATFYREVLSCNKENESIAVNLYDLRNVVKVNFLIVSTVENASYHPKNANTEYADNTYQISKGDVLAEGEEKSFIADYRFDPMTASVATFIKIQAGSFEEGIAQILPNPDLTIIILSRKDHDLYKSISGEKEVADLLHAGIVLPVLVEAIELVRDEDPDANERLIEVLKHRNLYKELLEQTKTPFEYAQMLLSADQGKQGPIYRALNKLSEFREGEGEK